MILRTVLAAALLAASFGCGSSYSAPASPSPTPSPAQSGPGTVSIVAGASSMTSTAYAPNPITVSVGGSVTWKNTDTVTHTTTSNNGAWDSHSIAPGGSFSMTFSSAGSFPYHCTIHPGMVGTVNVQ